MHKVVFYITSGCLGTFGECLPILAVHLSVVSFKVHTVNLYHDGIHVNTNLVSYHCGISLDNCDMKLLTIEEIRQKNLKLLIERHFSGYADLARAMNINSNSVSRWIAWPKENSRPITSDSARDIEDAANKRGANLPSGWLDHAHSQVDPEADALYAKAAEVDPEALKALLRVIVKEKP